MARQNVAARKATPATTKSKAAKKSAPRKTQSTTAKQATSTKAASKTAAKTVRKTTAKPAAKSATKAASRPKRTVAKQTPATTARTKKVAAKKSPRATTTHVLATGQRLELIRRKDWEFARRVHVTGVVGIVAVNAHQQLILVEQFREPVGKRVIELPAGLAGDIAGQEQEALVTAAQRELEEETGYQAVAWTPLNDGPSSAGLTDEICCLYLAEGCTRHGTGGGDASEDIQVHEISLTDICHWLREQVSAGKLIDHKVYAGLYFIQQAGLSSPIMESGIALVNSLPASVPSVSVAKLTSEDVPLEESLSLPDHEDA